MPSMIPSTTIVPSVRSSTAAKATSAQSGTGPIIWPRFLIGVTSSAGRPSIETRTSVPAGDVTRPHVAPSRAAIAALARSVAGPPRPPGAPVETRHSSPGAVGGVADVGLREVPGADALFDRGDLGVV